MSMKVALSGGYARLYDEATGNGWTLLHALQTHEGGDGRVPHGVAVVHRPRAPLEGREHACVGWAEQPYGASYFMSGNYDLTYEDAMRDMLERACPGLAA